MGRDDSWPATVPSVVVISFSFSEVHTTIYKMYKTKQAVEVECLRLVTVPTKPFTTPTDPFLSEWMKYQPGNTKNVETVLPIANLRADSESRSADCYSSFLVTIGLSRLVSEIFACDMVCDFP